MKTLYKICRVLFGLTFIVSGFTKLIDPVGTGLVVREYFSFLHLGFLSPLATEFGITMSALEMLTGICVLSGLFIKLFSFVGMAMMVAFTLVTVYLVLYNPISDCGCFGEAIHLTNWQSLGKNLILLPISIFIFVYSLKRTKRAGMAFNCTACAIFAAFAAGIGIYALCTLPGMDFASYKVGTDLAAITKGESAQYSTTFIYAKDGEAAEFTIDSLPDETWTYVDSKTSLVSGDGSEAMADISVRDANGIYRNEIFANEGAMIAVVVWDETEMTDEKWSQAETLRQQMQLSGVPFYLFSDNTRLVPESFAECTMVADRKALMTLLRSNGGAVYFNDGTVICKWPARAIGGASIREALNEDPDALVIDNSLKEKRYAMVVFGSLALMLLLYMVFRKIFFSNRGR